MGLRRCRTCRPYCIPFQEQSLAASRSACDWITCTGRRHSCMQPTQPTYGCTRLSQRQTHELCVTCRPLSAHMCKPETPDMVGACGGMVKEVGSVARSFHVDCRKQHLPTESDLLSPCEVWSSPDWPLPSCRARKREFFIYPVCRIGCAAGEASGRVPSTAMVSLLLV